MNRRLYLKHYRLRAEGEVLPPPVAESGPASTFRATDVRSGAPVLLTLVPVGAIPDEQREKFEANARSIVQFDHAHIARTVDFGQEGDEYAFVSEYPRGETTEQWVGQNGRLPPEAVLRIALQIVSAIGAAAYHQIFHADIRPENLVITPGQTAGGGWPAVKLTNLATGGIGASASAGAASTQFASPEQVRDGTVDLRSEIYSLGATMCFLLTGAFYSAEPRSLQTRRFARPLRKLIHPMLRQNPTDRPQDPVVLAESLRTCLEAVERRQLLAGRSGISFLAVRSPSARVNPPRPLPKQILAPMGGEVLHVDPPEEEEPSVPVGRRWSPAFAIVTALLLGLGIIGAAVIPARHFFFAHENNDKSGEIGVPIGVSQPAPVWDGKPLVMNKDRIPTAPVSEASAAPSAMAPSTSVAAEQPAAAVSAPSPTSPAVAQANRSEPAAPAKGPQSVWEKAGNRPLSERIVNKDGIASANNAEAPNDDKRAESTPESQPNTGDRTAANDRSEDVRPRLRPGSSVTARKPSRPITGHGSVARIASDGSVILRLPNGEIAVLPPPRDEYPVRRYHRPRRTYVAPEQPPGYPYLPPN
jgi:serine/threonine protein kinase